MLRLVAERLGELLRLGRPLVMVPQRRLGVCHGRGDGEQLGSDVHDSSQEGSVVLGAGLPPRHGVRTSSGRAVLDGALGLVDT